MAENDEILMTNDEGIPERTNGKHRHPERSEAESKNAAMEA
jgi:hypothetical protein